jgi:hypothetical protein
MGRAKKLSLRGAKRLSNLPVIPERFNREIASSRYALLAMTRRAPVMMLDPDSISLSGDVTAKFKKAKAPFW